MTRLLWIFFEFFSPPLINTIVAETNKFADARFSTPTCSAQGHTARWKEVTVDEIKGFFSLCLLMGIVKKSQLKLYWSRDHMVETTFYGNIMPRDRFKEILSNLHFVDNDQSY